MGIYDYIVIGIILLFGLKGLFKGLINEVFGILALVAGFVVAYKYSGTMGDLFMKTGASERTAEIIGFLAAFFIVYIVIIILGKLLSKAFKEIKLGWLNRGGGFVFGAVTATVVLSLVLSTAVNVMPKDFQMRKDVTEQKVSGYIISLAPTIYDLLGKMSDGNKNNIFKFDKDLIDPKKIMENEKVKEIVDKHVKPIVEKEVKEKLEDIKKEELEKVLEEK